MVDEAKSGQFRGKWTRESFCDALKGKDVTITLLSQGDSSRSGVLRGMLMGWDASSFFIQTADGVVMVSTRAVATLAATVTS